MPLGLGTGGRACKWSVEIMFNWICIDETIFAKPSSNGVNGRKCLSMFSFRGDAHKIYLKLKRALNKEQSFQSVKEIGQIEQIQNFYMSIDSPTLKKIYVCMIKEKNGSGLIPILVSSGPWLLLLFAEQLQKFLFKNGSGLWIFFVFAYIFILTISVILHFHEKSWASVHTEIIQEILQERKEPSKVKS